MIPRRLEITNFLSYRETASLDFTGLHLACIAGRNGAGKSSLLDAITWALFGKSRARSDDDLVNRYAARENEEAIVQFTFELEGAVYRVIRRKKLRRATSLELQLGLPDGAWSALTEGRVRETQAAIEDLLRMNYDTFSNASFLLQGQADAFTVRTASQRKTILAELLGVDEWEGYRAQVSERRRREEGKLVLLDGRLADTEAELAEGPERQAALDEARAQVDDIQVRLATQETLLAQVRTTADALRQQRQQLKRLEAEIERSESILAARRQEQAEQQARRARHQATLAAAEEIEASYQAWEAARDRQQAWEAKASELGRLQRDRHQHELKLTQARTSLEQQRDSGKLAQARVAEQRQERDRLLQERAELESDLNGLRQKLVDLTAEETAWHEARAARRDLKSQRDAWEQERARLLEQERALVQQAAEETDFEANRQQAAGRIEALDTELKVLRDQATRWQILTAQIKTHESEQPRLKQQMNEIKERLGQLEGETGGACPLCGQALSEAHRQKVLAELNQEGTARGDRYRENKAKLTNLRTEAQELQDVIGNETRVQRELEAQKDRLLKAEKRLTEIRQAQTTWAAAGGRRLVELTDLLADRTELDGLQAREAELAQAAQALAELRRQEQAADRQLASLEARGNQLEADLRRWEAEGQPALAEVQARLSADDFAPEARAALQALDEQIAALAYDPAAHEEAQQAAKALAEAPQRRQALQQAATLAGQVDDRLASLSSQIESEAERLAGWETQRDKLSAGLAQLEGEATIDLAVLEDQVADLREADKTARNRLAVAQSRVEVLANLKARQGQLQEERASLTRLIGRLRVLEEACGRNGVPALLIEQALPDIELQANALLERLSNGEMRVNFDTQRQMKSRDELQETLDIHIVDAAGERPYENYSGGEQFRVNFAIRLALSQVLARRAGARLQTLVVDEGFGSQDPTGRQRLVEAINTIQHDFACILVITHIDELKDAFPSRIEVSKDAGGSRVAVYL